MSSAEITTKQMQLMMNLSLLQSLKQKPTPAVVPIYIPIITPAPPQMDFCFQGPMNPQHNQNIQEEQKILTQMSYISPHSTVMSYKTPEDRVPTNDTSYYYNTTPYFLSSGMQKSYTSNSFQLSPSMYREYNSFLGQKTTRNTIIINENGECEDDKESKIVKHHTAPIKVTQNMLQSKAIFETHLLKKQIEYNEEDKKYKCGHKGCDLAYKTKKQRASHHGKMDPECQRDSIEYLSLISTTKNILFSLIKENKIKNTEKLKEISKNYENIMDNISINEYAQLICGNKFKIPMAERE